MPRDKYIERDGLIFRVLKIFTNQFGYKFIKPVNQNGKSTVYIHRLVYRTFVGVIPSEMEINHIDHNRANNAVENLELMSHLENMQEALAYNNRAAKRCKCCGKRIYSKKTVYCTRCRKKKKIKIPRPHKYEHPSKEVLWKLIKSMPFTSIGKMYCVTDNAIRKLAKSYGIPSRKRDIERQIEEENSLLDSCCIGES